MAFGDPRQLLAWDGESVVLKPSASLDADAVALLAGIEESRSRDGTTSIRLKLADKHAARVELARILGLTNEQASLHLHQHLHVTAEGVSDRRLEEFTLDQLRAMVARQEASDPGPQGRFLSGE